MTDSNESLERLGESTEPLESRLNQFQTQLKHIDELLERAKKGAAAAPAPPAIRAQLEKARQERDRFFDHLGRLKKMSSDEISEEMIEKAGPMGVWDAVAQELERLVERVERK